MILYNFDVSQTLMAKLFYSNLMPFDPRDMFSSIYKAPWCPIVKLLEASKLGDQAL